MTQTNETQTNSNNPDAQSFWHRRPTLWLAGGLGAAALLVGGIGLGSAIADDGDDDDDRSLTSQPLPDDTDDADLRVTATGTSPSYGATDAAALSAILASAGNESSGTPTSMEAHRNGSWSVDLEAANGDETTVLVAADGSASVVRTEAADSDDANDPAPIGKLTRPNLAAAVEAALDRTKGVILEIDVDDNPAEAYSVQVRTDRGTEIEIDLDADFAVTKVDVDKD